jgi:hypothetical protein
MFSRRYKKFIYFDKVFCLKKSKTISNFLKSSLKKCNSVIFSFYSLLGTVKYRFFKLQPFCNLGRKEKCKIVRLLLITFFL